MDNKIYANRFAITTNKTKDIFLNFYLDVPRYDEKNNFVGVDTVDTQMVIMTESAYENFRNMLDEAEAKENDKNEDHD